MLGSGQIGGISPRKIEVTKADGYDIPLQNLKKQMNELSEIDKQGSKNTSKSTNVAKQDCWKEIKKSLEQSFLNNNDKVTINYTHNDGREDSMTTKALYSKACRLSGNSWARPDKQLARVVNSVGNGLNALLSLLTEEGRTNLFH